MITQLLHVQNKMSTFTNKYKKCIQIPSHYASLLKIEFFEI
jgi:hypothetical protein